MKKLLIIDGSNLLFQMFFGMPSRIVNADKIAKPSIKESILRNTERLHNNYKLIKLDDMAIIPFDLEELNYSYNGITTNEVLKGIRLRR